MAEKETKMRASIAGEPAAVTTTLVQQTVFPILPLLEKSDISESKGFGGFPVSGQWLKCINPEIIKKHNAKVYGKAAVGSPPMSVPHLDTRMIDGKKALLFGPYAGFSTKFLKNGSFMDLPLSIKANNILPMLAAGIHNISLTK